jgi:hemoglobin-like flavoprotein
VASLAGLFKFGRVEGFDPKGDLAANKDLVKHGSDVVTTVGAAVGLLDDLPTLGPVLVDLGARHIAYAVQPVHYPLVGAAFLKTLEMGLGDAYTTEVAEAYTAMWGVVEAAMLSDDPSRKVAV